MDPSLISYMEARWGGGGGGLTNNFPSLNQKQQKHKKKPNWPIVHSSLILANSPPLDWNIPHDFSPEVSGILCFIFVHEV